jgi:hypothetical protein
MSFGGYTVHMDKPSQLVKDLGRIESGQRKALVTCCVGDCVNEVEIVLTETNWTSLKGGSAFIRCSFHSPAK